MSLRPVRQPDKICDRAERMDDVLLGIVLGRLAEFPLPEQAADFLLAALDGDESLSAQLTGQAQAKITAGFVVEGTGSATAQRTWPAAADFAASSASVQVSGEKQAGIERLGWTAALTDYRPFLSHSELEAFFGSPSGLYELLA